MIVRGDSHQAARAGGPLRAGHTFARTLTLLRALTIPITLTLALTSSIPLTAHAEASLKSSVRSVCSKTLANTENTSVTDTNSSMKLSYCQAAKSAQEGADSDSSLWKVWTAVGTVCTAACIASFAGYNPLGAGQQFVCAGATVAGGITDAAVTKNYAGILMSIGSAGAGLAMNNTFSKSGEKAAPKEAQKDIGACVSAGNAAFQAFTRYSSMKTQEASAKTNLAAADKLTTQASNSANSDGSTVSINSGTSSSGSSGSTATTAEISSDSENDNDNCAQAKGSNNSQLYVSCAVASDNTLPGFVTSPRFQDQFKKTSGQTLDDFLAKSESPAAALMEASSSGLTASQSAQLAAAIQQAQGQVESEVEGSSYAGGGGGSGSGAGAEDDGFGSMMQGLMDQFMPKTGDAKGKNSGLAAVAFANKRRPASRIAEDPKLSIFDRVTFRYFAVGRRLVEVK